MKLYHDTAEGWQLPGKQARKAERVDVPTEAPKLCAWLNARRVPLEGDAFDGLVPLNPAAHELLAAAREGDELQLTSEPHRPKVAGHCDACGRSTASALTLQKGNEIDTIIEWAAEAPDWAVARLAERIVELSAEIKGSTRQ